MTSDINPVDVVRFTAARVMVSLTQARSRLDNDVLAILGDLHRDLSSALRRLCPEGQDPEAHASRYSDGRPVISAMPLDAGPVLYVHAWHPDPTHPMTNPCELDVITTPDGVRRRIIVNAPGYLDAVTFDENAGAGDGQPALAHTE
jgi:hypothetical protein